MYGRYTESSTETIFCINSVYFPFFFMECVITVVSSYLNGLEVEQSVFTTGVFKRYVSRTFIPICIPLSN